MKNIVLYIWSYYKNHLYLHHNKRGTCKDSKKEKGFRPPTGTGTIKISENMKKTFAYLSFVLFALMGCMNLASCSDSDGQDAGTLGNRQIAGKWFYVSSNYISLPAGTEKPEDFISWMYFTEYGDMSFYDTDLQSIIYADYRLEKDKLTVYNIENDSYMPFTYTIKKLTSTELVVHVKLEGLYEAEFFYKKDK